MKKILGLILFPTLLLAAHAQFTFSQLGSAYSAMTISPNLTRLPSNQAHLAIVNGTGCRVCIFSENKNPANVPPTPSLNEHCTQANAQTLWDFVSVYNSVYQRYDGASCASGIVDVDSW